MEARPLPRVRQPTQDNAGSCEQRVRGGPPATTAGDLLPSRHEVYREVPTPMAYGLSVIPPPATHLTRSLAHSLAHSLTHSLNCNLPPSLAPPPILVPRSLPQTALSRMSFKRPEQGHLMGKSSFPMGSGTATGPSLAHRRRGPYGLPVRRASRTRSTCSSTSTFWARIPVAGG